MSTGKIRKMARPEEAIIEENAKAAGLQVDVEMENLQAAVSALEGTASELVARLECVAFIPDEVPEGEKEAQELVPLASDIRALRNRVQVATSALGKTLSGLQL